MDRERTESDQRANAVRIAASGKKALRSARTASERVERLLLSSLPATDRTKFLKMLSVVVGQAETANPSTRKETRPGTRRSR